MPIDHKIARQTLDREFTAQEEGALRNQVQGLADGQLAEQLIEVFSSKTLAYREVLLGCLLAKLQDPTIDVHKPYKGHGQNSYNGRTLDEEVVNPFLHDKRIPSTKGPFLSKFRRSVGFEASTKTGTRDKKAFDSFISIVDRIDESNEKELTELLAFALYNFVQVRDAAEVPLARLQRMSLEQYDSLIDALLATPSGGRFPVIFIAATFTAISEAFKLAWRLTSKAST